MNILVIDDDRRIRELLQDTLKNENYDVFTAEDGINGLDVLLKEKIDVCFLDLWMPNVGGIETLKKIKEEYPDVEIIMISGDAKIDHAVKATKIGAYDFIEKPLSVKEVVTTIKRLEKQLQKRQFKNEYKNLQNERLLGKSEVIKNVKELIKNSCKSDARILITGENGTGKEIAAREIHIASDRKNKPFIGVNCAAIPEALIESELFGHVKGAFTGATCNRIGKFEQADTGTLFLDEVADMSLSTQAKVLRVLQEMRIIKIGSTESVDIDVRIISATNKDIKEEINIGNFREDLYYRLNVIPIYIPPLRERKVDIPIFIEYFLKDIAKKNSYKKKTITPDALNFMIEYPWPGNIRQLRNIIERLTIMVTKNEIDLLDVKQYIDSKSEPVKDFIINSKYEKYKLNVAREAFEKDFIESKLKENNYNLSRTAKALGLYPSNLHSKIQKLGITIEKIKNK